MFFNTIKKTYWLVHFIIEPSNTDNSEWSSNYSFGDTPKQMPEDDLGMF